MKKLISIFGLLLLVSTMTFAQEEVRGIETRRIIYDGPEYYECYSSYTTSTKYYGWEIWNRNSIPVSITIELWSQGATYSNGVSVIDTGHHIVKTKDMILAPGEKYVFKREEHKSTKVNAQECSDWKISSYYIKYKAYKLL